MIVTPEVDADDEVIRSKRRFHALQEWNEKRPVRIAQIFEIDIDPLKTIRQDPLPQLKNDVGL